MKKLLLHIPHASVVIPFYDGYINDQLKIEKEQLKLTDWYTDELFFSSSDILIKAPFSRIFCDVERFENDADEVMSKYGMGAVYTHFDSGELMREVTPNLRNSIMQEYYWKHHNEFTFAVSNELEKNGTCLIVDCHSYPSTPVTRDLNQSPQRPDFNIGIDPFHTPQFLIDASVAFFEEKGYSLGVDWPYSGTIVPMAFYQKNPNVHSIMLEINRGLYLLEPGNEKSEQFTAIKQVVQDFLKMLKNKY
ncbi:N-formylglutamate amidohydrolase [Flavobacterium chungnamense]|uniref:N-formylglutamate amidohydrolase n=1 Tax=Flavobacterium chungnamense TaxID=706182 RepID=A0ABP7UV03_9FLAO